MREHGVGGGIVWRRRRVWSVSGRVSLVWDCESGMRCGTNF